MNKKTQADRLNTIIRHTVLAELEAILPDLLSEIRSAVDKQVTMLLEAEQSRSQLIEHVELKEPKRPPLDRKRLADIIGAEFDGQTILATTRTMKTQAPVTPSDPTDKAEIAQAELHNALTRDYSGLMSRLNSIRPDKPNDMVRG